MKRLHHAFDVVGDADHAVPERASVRAHHHEGGSPRVGAEDDDLAGSDDLIARNAGLSDEDRSDGLPEGERSSLIEMNGERRSRIRRTNRIRRLSGSCGEREACRSRAEHQDERGTEGLSVLHVFLNVS